MCHLYTTKTGINSTTMGKDICTSKWPLHLGPFPSSFAISILRTPANGYYFYKISTYVQKVALFCKKFLMGSDGRVLRRQI